MKTIFTLLLLAIGANVFAGAAETAPNNNVVYSQQQLDNYRQQNDINDPRNQADFSGNDYRNRYSN